MAFVMSVFLFLGCVRFFEKRVKNRFSSHFFRSESQASENSECMCICYGPSLTTFNKVSFTQKQSPIQPSHMINELFIVYPLNIPALDHFMSCTKLSGKHVRHSFVVDSTRNLCHSAGIPTYREYIIPEGRLDVAFTNLNFTPSYGDVTITHPSAKTYLDGAAVKAGSAASLREHKKINTYSSMLSPDDSFYPLVLETYGYIGKTFLQLLQRIGFEYSRRCSDDSMIVAFKKKIIADISCSLQKGNASILDEGLRRGMF